MAHAHERFVGARVLLTFTVAAIAQAIIFLITIRLGLLGFFLGPVFFLAYIAYFGRSFLLALRRLQILRSSTLRFAMPILCTIVLLFCSLVAGGYIGYALNNTVFHIPEEDFDK